jgi:hypothetical protein
MYLYRITLDSSIDYDMYDSAVVIATSEEEARTIHPDGRHRWDEESKDWGTTFSGTIGSWGRPEQVTVELIGIASSGEIGDVVVSSFNAG